MNRSALKGATATVALLVGLGIGDPALAAGRDTDQAIQRVRQHVQSLKQSHKPKAQVHKVKAAKPTLKPGIVLASYSAEELAADSEEAEDMAEEIVVEVSIDPEPGDEPAPVAAARPAEPQPVVVQAPTPAPQPVVAQAPQPAPQPVVAQAPQPEPQPQPVAAQPAPPPVPEPRPVVAQPAPQPQPPQPQTAQAQPQPQPQPQAQTARAESRQQVNAAAEVPPQPELPGVLTKRGTLVVEPSIEYTHTDVNQFSFGGVAILDTVLIGAIQASQANRDAVTGTLGLRYGITNRLEGELRVPYMYRSDNSTATFVNASGNAQRVSASDHGLGDIEAAVRYQLNDGVGKWPVMVANFRAKSTTGTSPYDVARNAQGVEEELPTGSGFWGFEPSLTLIAPSDPAVFFANVGYLWNVKNSGMNKRIGNRVVNSVDPGDAVRFGVGMGLALNEKVSFSVGYQHDWIMSTKTKFDLGQSESDSLSVGALTFGVNWQMADNASLNVSVGVGVTNDSPDVRLMARVPIAISLF